MKKQKNFPVRMPLLATLLAFLMIPVSCQKEDVADPADPYVPLDREAHLIGYFNSLNQIAFIDPAYLEDVLAEWGALPQPTDEGYTMVDFLENGDKVEYFFFIEPVPAPLLAQQAAEQEKIVLDKAEGKGADRKFTYKNATCPDDDDIKNWQNDLKKGSRAAKEAAKKKLEEGFRDKQAKPGGCTNKEVVDDDKIASFHHHQTNAYKKCMYSKEETNTCTETKRVVGTTTYYEDQDCKGNVVKTSDYTQFVCGLFE